MAAAFALGLLPTAGCSWLLVQKPPRGPIQPAPPLQCTSSVAAPVADTVGAVLLGVTGVILTANGLGLLGASCAPGDPGCTTAQISGAAIVAVGLVGVGTGTALAFSAGNGYSTTAECRELKDAQLSCSSGVEASCRRLQEPKP